VDEDDQHITCVDDLLRPQFESLPGVVVVPERFNDLSVAPEDASLVHRLTAGTPRLSLHIPWDECPDLDEILTDARRLGIGFDAVNSNTFQDQPGQPLSYKFGSFSNPNAAVRRQAIEHHLRVIEIGKQVGSKALSVWLADG